MTPTRERQRAAARARLEREMAARAAQARRRRRMQAIIGGSVAALLVIGGVTWLVVSQIGDDKPAGPSAAAPVNCTWTDITAEQKTPQVKDTGKPPTNQPPSTGSQVMSVATSFGDVQVTMDLSKVPCTAASFAFLAGQKYFDGSKCHRMFEGVLQCGDPNAKGAGYRETDGQGGPGYRFANENLPIGQRPAYPAGVVAMANSGPDTNGSQFFFVYKDVDLQPDYTILGKITGGMDVLVKATAAGHNGKFDPSPGGGNPKSDIVLKSVTVSTPAP